MTDINQSDLEIIQKVCQKIASKYVFGYFEFEDIKQEAIIMSLQLVKDKWDGIRPLENFLSISVSNKLKNLKRRHYCRIDIPEDNPKRVAKNLTKRNLVETGELFDTDLITSDSILDDVITRESDDLLYQSMPVFVKSDYKRILNSVKIPKARSLAVHAFIRGYYEDR